MARQNMNIIIGFVPTHMFLETFESQAIVRELSFF